MCLFVGFCVILFAVCCCFVGSRKFFLFFSDSNNPKLFYSKFRSVAQFLREQNLLDHINKKSRWITCEKHRSVLWLATTHMYMKICDTVFRRVYLSIVCYTAVFSVVTQCSSTLTAAENRITFLSLCVCGQTNKPITYKKFDNTWTAGR